MRALRALAWAAGTCAGLGYLPAGGLLVTVLAVLLARALAPLGLASYMLVLAGLAGVAVWSIDELAPASTERVVLAQAPGLLLAVLPGTPDPWSLLLGLALYRLFWLWRPVPARGLDAPGSSALERVAGPLFCGAYAGLALYAVDRAGSVRSFWNYVIAG
jgi:phosphatidylglycerophosphatase A